MPLHRTVKAVLVAVAFGVVVAVTLLAIEFFGHTRFDSRYIPVQSRKPYLLSSERERGLLVQFDGRGYHSAEPGTTQTEFVERIRKQYPNEFDPKKLVWVLRDEEGAFFYRLSPNWLSVALLATLAAALFSPYANLKTHARYPKYGRLADVLALLQVLAKQENATRSEKGISLARQGPPRSASSWTVLASDHPEFFRVNQTSEHPVSLVARFATQTLLTTPVPLEPQEAQSLINTAILLHERETALLQRWQVWVPVVAAIVAGLFALATISTT